MSFYTIHPPIWGEQFFLDSSSLIIDSGILSRISLRMGGPEFKILIVYLFGELKESWNEMPVLLEMADFYIKGLIALVQNLLIVFLSGNRANRYGGVVRASAKLTFTNCTIVGNESLDAGGVVILFEGDSLNLENSILWNNHSLWGNEIAYTAAPHPLTIRYLILQNPKG